MSKIVGLGKALPPRRMCNHEFEGRLDTTDEWIRSRTGIVARHLLEEKSLSTLAEQALRQALEQAGITAADLDVLLVATMTPDERMPSMACRVAGALGIEGCLCFDINAACSGFLYGFMTADSLLAGGRHYAAVIGAEALSRVLDWEDRNTCILFGDGAGAVVLEADGRPAGYTAGTKPDSSGQLELGCGGSDCIRMKGREVYKFATHIVPELIRQLCESSKTAVSDIDKVVAHQANIRILQSAAEKTGIPIERWFSDLADHGNTSAASVPIALYDAWQEGFLEDGDRVALAGFGGGLTYGGVLVDWCLPKPKR
ncbi:MAG: beta-ketoacyl-ACP synthase III [Lachnospiraceae bacterium]|nr:beta-ketoacyl-ACP synthase III [Lachnospiraceae bacterium]